MSTGYDRSYERGWDFDPVRGSWRPPGVSSAMPPTEHTHPEYEPLNHTHPGSEIDSLPASKVTTGTFASGDYAFPAKVTMDGDLLQFPSTINDNKINLWGTSYSLGVRSNTLLLHSGGASGDSVFLFEKSDGADVAAITASGVISAGAGTGRTYVGPHPVHAPSGWASFGHWDHKDSSSAYAFMQNADGSTLINCLAGKNVRTVVGGQSRLTVAADVTVYSELYCNNWFRSNTLGEGWFHQAGGGGWQMQDTTWMRIYGGKGVLLEGGQPVLVIRTDDAGSYADRSFQGRSPSRPGMACYATNTGRVTQILDQGSGFDATNSTTSAGVPYRASAFQTYSARSGKRDIRYLSKRDEWTRFQQLKPARFVRPHASLCGACDGTGRVSMVEWMRRVAIVEPTEDTPPEAHQEQDCPTCSGNGVPGQINSPAIDKNEDTDFVGFVAEEIAEIYPEVVGWEPSDPDDWQSAPRPAAVDIGAMTAVLTVAIQDLEARIVALEGQKGVS